MGGSVPSGWTVYSRFNDASTGASATVLKSTTSDSYIVAFRGTDDALDRAHYPLLGTGAYIRLFDSLLKALPSGAEYYVTGASLGGGAANQLADIAGSAYGGKFASATFVAFASPNISASSRIVNFGFENDPVFKMLANYGDRASSLDNVALANSEYMAGNYDGHHPYSWGAHVGTPELFDRIAKSAFYEQMHADSPLIFVQTKGVVTDMNPHRASTGAFYLGRSTADQITGRAGADFLEGFAGNDILRGGGGSDHLAGGAGNDTLYGDGGTDTAVFSGMSTDYTWTKNSDGSWTVVDNRKGGPDGSDRLYSVELLKFSDLTEAVGGSNTPVTVIEANGSTHLTAVGDRVYLYDSAGSGPSVKYRGAEYVAGQFPGWTPISAEKTASGGYQIAWKVTGQDKYTIWNTDSQGNYTSSALGTVSGSDATLQNMESSFFHDLNGNGTIGVPTAATSLGDGDVVRAPSGTRATANAELALATLIDEVSSHSQTGWWGA